MQPWRARKGRQDLGSGRNRKGLKGVLWAWPGRQHWNRGQVLNPRGVDHSDEGVMAGRQPGDRADPEMEFLGRREPEGELEWARESGLG